MPIKVQNDLPAKAIIESENIFIIDEKKAGNQDIRPLEIGILNLMPNKEDTEIQLLRMLSMFLLLQQPSYSVFPELTLY